MFFCRWKAVPRESLSVVCCRMLASNVILLPHIYRSRIKGTEEFCPQDPPPPYEAVQRQNSSEQVWPTGLENPIWAWEKKQNTLWSTPVEVIPEDTCAASLLYLPSTPVFPLRAVLSCEAAMQAKLKLELCTVILQKSLRPRALAVTGFEIQCLIDNKIYAYVKQLVAQNLKQSSSSMNLDIRELVENTKSLLKSDEKHMAEAITSATFFEQVQAMSLCTRVLPFRQHPGLLYLESCGDLNTFTTGEHERLRSLAGVVRETVF
uniref:Family with sequence similarity 189 member A2 n=1 Tax=Buteo japonicus TaxID=224669 RepID=A0A8C0HRN7_9AVES